MKINFENIKHNPDSENKYLMQKFMRREALIIAYNQEESNKICDLLHKVGYQFKGQTGNKGVVVNNDIVLYGLNKENYSNGGIPVNNGHVIGCCNHNFTEYKRFNVIIQPSLFLENFEKYFYESKMEI